MTAAAPPIVANRIVPRETIGRRARPDGGRGELWTAEQTDVVLRLWADTAAIMRATGKTYDAVRVKRSRLRRSLGFKQGVPPCA